jgi:phosphoribosylglycinamide formyltransferase-1
MLDLIQSIKFKQLTAEIVIVLSNKADALILENAKHHGYHSAFIDPNNLTREEYDQKLSQKFQESNVELIILIGYMRILSGAFLKDWQNKVINVHPSLLPAHAGKRDHEVHQAVLNAKENQTGCTVHYVTEEIDAGPIIIQEKCIVLKNDNVDRLKARVQALEGVALIAAIKQLME